MTSHDCNANRDTHLIQGRNITNLASILLQRHDKNRKRFDSADYMLDIYNKTRTEGCQLTMTDDATLEGSLAMEIPSMSHESTLMVTKSHQETYQAFTRFPLKRFNSADDLLEEIERRQTDESTISEHNLAHKILSRHCFTKIEGQSNPSACDSHTDNIVPQ